MRQKAGRDRDPWRHVLGDLLDMLELQERQLKRITRCLDARLEEQAVAEGISSVHIGLFLRNTYTML